MVHECTPQLSYQMQPLTELSRLEVNLVGNLGLLMGMWFYEINGKAISVVDLVQIIVSVCLKQELTPNNVLPDNFVHAIEYSDYNSVSS